MRLVFADTLYLAALLNARDQWHELAVSAAESLDDTVVVTSELVLIELLNHAATSRGARESAVDFARQLRARNDVRIIPATTAQFQSALRFYERSSDKEWSLVDCASFLIMKQHRIRDALTHDKHFIQAGFRALLREC